MRSTRFEAERAAWLRQHTRGWRRRVRAAAILARRARRTDSEKVGTDAGAQSDAVPPGWWGRSRAAGRRRDERGDEDDAAETLALAAGGLLLVVVGAALGGIAALTAGIVYATWWLVVPRLGPIRPRLLVTIGALVIIAGGLLSVGGIGDGLRESIAAAAPAPDAPTPDFVHAAWLGFAKWWPIWLAVQPGVGIVGAALLATDRGWSAPAIQRPDSRPPGGLGASPQRRQNAPSARTEAPAVAPIPVDEPDEF